MQLVAGHKERMAQMHSDMEQHARALSSIKPSKALEIVTMTVLTHVNYALNFETLRRNKDSEGV
jgi:hypothetical protein